MPISPMVRSTARRPVMPMAVTAPTAAMTGATYPARIIRPPGALTSDAWTSVASGNSSTGADTYNAGGSHDSLATTTYTDGSTYSTDTVTQADGSYQQSWTESDGSYGTNGYVASTGEMTGSNNTAGAAYSYVWNTTELSGGATETKETYAYTDGSTYSTDTVAQADGSYQQSWTDSNGRYGSNTVLNNKNASLDFAGGANNITLGNGLDTVQTTGGQNQINLGQSAAVLVNNGATDWVNMGNVGPDQLWFSQSGEDLVVNVLDSSESLTVQGWFNGQADQVSSFSANGLALYNSGIEQLVQAMAAYPVPSAGQTSYTAQEQQTLNPLVATSWK